MRKEPWRREKIFSGERSGLVMRRKPWRTEIMCSGEKGSFHEKETPDIGHKDSQSHHAVKGQLFLSGMIP
jgi:hypothetical protein